MTIAHAVFLGLIQGLTEFLPVSSSGHLVTVPQLLGWQEQPLAFDVALHLGTTAAVLLYYLRRFVALIRCGLHDLWKERINFTNYSPTGRLAWMLVLSCVPAVVVGGLFNSWIEAHVRSPYTVAVLLVLFGLYMLAAERFAVQRHETEQAAVPHALLIGLAQAVALLPGVSRSGATISTGMFTGLTRRAAADFSFLMSAPVIVGAGLLEAPKLRHAAEQGVSTGVLLAGMIVAFLSGLAAITILLRWVGTRPLTPFVWYRFAFAALIVVVMVLK